MNYITYSGNNQKINSCITYFNDTILGVLSYENNINCWIAGGAVRAYIAGEKIKDIDVFFPSEDEYNKAYNVLKDLNHTIIFENQNVVKFLYKGKVIDLVKRFFSSPIETITQFDFTVTCSAVAFNRFTDGQFFHHVDFFVDLSNKALTINSLPFPLSTLQRLQKYIKRGYHICNGGLLELAKAIQQLDLDDKNQNSMEFYPDGTPRFIRFD